MGYTSMDPQTAKVAAQLQLRDIADLLDSLYDDAPPPEGDELAALTLTQRNLRQQLARLEDQIIIIQILKAEHDDRVAIEKLLDDEKQAASDHQFALRLAGMSVSDEDAASSTDHEAQLGGADDSDDDTQWEVAKQLYTSAFEEDDSHNAIGGGPVQPGGADRAPLHEVRTVAADQQQHRVLNSEDLIKCDACMEIVSVKTTLRLQCTHNYCRVCLLDLSTSAISNTTLFPPRCCKVPVPLDTCRVMLPRELIKEFDLKVEELATPNPTYCANGDCSRFIQPKDIRRDVRICVFCKETTCV